MIDAILTNTVLPAISQELLTRMMEGTPVEKVHVTVEDGEIGYEFYEASSRPFVQRRI